MTEPDLQTEARKLLLAGVAAAIRAWGVSQPVAARRLGTSQARVNIILKEKHQEASLNNLFDLAEKVGVELTLKVNDETVQLKRSELIVNRKPQEEAAPTAPASPAPAQAAAKAKAKAAPKAKAATKDKPKPKPRPKAKAAAPVA